MHLARIIHEDICCNRQLSGIWGRIRFLRLAWPHTLKNQYIGNIICMDLEQYFFTLSGRSRFSEKVLSFPLGAQGIREAIDRGDEKARDDVDDF
jgi:hypothetical protein